LNDEHSDHVSVIFLEIDMQEDNKGQPQQGSQTNKPDQQQGQQPGQKPGQQQTQQPAQKPSQDTNKS
jgi:BRCT domain type II-containing protein